MKKFSVQFAIAGLIAAQIGRFASLIAINTDQICSIGATPPVRNVLWKVLLYNVLFSLASTVIASSEAYIVVNLSF